MEIVHASAAAFGCKAVLIIGNSGSGKTTLLLELLQIGAKFIADDAVSILGEEKGLFVGCTHSPIAYTKDNGFIDISSVFGNDKIARSAELRLIVSTGTEELFVRDQKLVQRLGRIQKIDISELDLATRVKLVKEFFEDFNG